MYLPEKIISIQFNSIQFNSVQFNSVVNFVYSWYKKEWKVTKQNKKCTAH